MNLTPAVTFRLDRYTRNPEMKLALESVAAEVFELETVKKRLLTDARSVEDPIRQRHAAGELTESLLAGQGLPADVVGLFAEEVQYANSWQYAQAQLIDVLHGIEQRQELAVDNARPGVLKILDTAIKNVVDALRKNAATGLGAADAISAGLIEEWREVTLLLARYSSIRQAQALLDSNAKVAAGGNPVVLYLANPTEAWSDYIEHLRGRLVAPRPFSEDRRDLSPTPWPPDLTQHDQFALWLAATPTATPWVPTVAQVEHLAACILAAVRGEQRSAAPHAGGPGQGAS